MEFQLVLGVRCLERFQEAVRQACPDLVERLSRNGGRHFPVLHFGRLGAGSEPIEGLPQAVSLIIQATEVIDPENLGGAFQEKLGTLLDNPRYQTG